MNKTMKAAILYGIGDIRTEFTEIPAINDNEALVKVKYVGICGSDLPRAMISGLSGNASYPIILGHEFSGEIASIGKNVNNFKIGDRVVVAPLIPCGECNYCKEGAYGLCEHYKIIGTRTNGAMAEYVKVPKQHLIKIPENLDFETAAGIEPATIAYHGIAKTKIKPGDNVAILGCGPIGQFAIQWAKIFGANRIFAFDVFNDKLELAKQLGATDIINSKEVDPIQKIYELTESGVDVVAETAGNKFTQEQALQIVKKHGHVVFIGISHSELLLKAKSAEGILRKELTINGAWNSYTMPYPGRAWTASVEFMEKGTLVFKPMVSHKIKLEEVGKYLSKMAKREIKYNKVLVEI